jgi:hypothetical protein
VNVRKTFPRSAYAAMRDPSVGDRARLAVLVTFIERAGGFAA